MKCPRDNAPLVFVDDGNHLRDRCPRCQGVLLDRAEVAVAIGPNGGKSVASAAGKLGSLPEGAGVCPREGAKMRRLDYRGVELDLCPECSSLWLDAGELEKIRALGSTRKSAGRKAALAGAAAVAAGAAMASSGPDKQSLVSGVAEVVGEVAVDGAIELVFEFIGEAIGSLF